MGLGKHVGWGKGGDFEVIKWGGRGGGQATKEWNNFYGEFDPL